MTFHSIWLRPARDDLKFLESIVAELAGHFASPVFEPHATLVTDMKRSADELLPLVLSLAVGRKPLDILIENVTGTEAYFRFFYATLQKTPALMALKQVSTRYIWRERHLDFPFHMFRLPMALLIELRAKQRWLA